MDFVGGPYHVTGLSPAQYRLLADHFRDVIVPSPTGDARHAAISVRRIPTRHFQPTADESRELSFDLQADPDGVEIAGESLCARINCNGQTDSTLWTDLEAGFFTRNVFENFFRIAVTYRLLEHGGLLLHSAATAATNSNQNRGRLLPSGSGTRNRITR